MNIPSAHKTATEPPWLLMSTEQVVAGISDGLKPLQEIPGHFSHLLMGMTKFGIVISRHITGNQSGDANSPLRAKSASGSEAIVRLIFTLCSIDINGCSGMQMH